MGSREQEAGNGEQGAGLRAHTSPCSTELHIPPVPALLASPALCHQPGAPQTAVIDGAAAAAE